MRQVLYHNILLCSAVFPFKCLAADNHVPNPIRIVSLSLASDEILLDILPSCGGLGRLAALSVLADSPESSNVVTKAKTITKRVHSEPESVLTLKPDLVIGASFNQPALLNLIKTRNIPLKILTEFRNIADIKANILAIGDLLGCKPQAERIVLEFTTRISSIDTLAAVHNNRGPAILYSADLSVLAGDTLFDDLLRINHLTNVATSAGLKLWPTVSAEVIAKWNPQWIVVLCEQAQCAQKILSLKKETAWKNLQAVKDNRFLYIESKLAMSTSHYFGGLLIQP